MLTQIVNATVLVAFDTHRSPLLAEFGRFGLRAYDHSVPLGPGAGPAVETRLNVKSGFSSKTEHNPKGPRPPQCGRSGTASLGR